MKIALATDGAVISPHFGHCSEFTVVTVENGKAVGTERVANPEHQPGFLPEYLSKMGGSCIIAGGMGPSAQELFAAKGIIERHDFGHGRGRYEEASRVHHDHLVDVDSGRRVVVCVRFDCRAGEPRPLRIEPRLLFGFGQVHPFRPFGRRDDCGRTEGAILNLHHISPALTRANGLGLLR